MKGSASLIIFDLDGTLIDSSKDIAAAVNAARAAFLLPALSFSEIISMVGDGIEALAQRSFRNSSISVPDACREIMRQYRSRPVQHTKLYSGVAETLPRLKPRKAVVSNKPIELTRIILQELGIQGFFDSTAGGDSQERRKPDPQAVESLLEQYQVRRDRALVVGDHVNDLEMARRAGVKSVFCSYGFFPDAPVEFGFSIPSFAELLPIVERLGLNRPE